MSREWKGSPPLTAANIYRRQNSKNTARWVCAAVLNVSLMIAFSLQYSFPGQFWGAAAYLVSIGLFLLIEPIVVRRASTSTPNTPERT